MTTPCQIIRLADRRPQPRPEPPVNAGLELVALWWAVAGEWCHLMSMVLRPPR